MAALILVCALKLLQPLIWHLQSYGATGLWFTATDYNPIYLVPGLSGVFFPAWDPKQGSSVLLGSAALCARVVGPGKTGCTDHSSPTFIHQYLPQTCIQKEKEAESACSGDTGPQIWPCLGAM